MSLQQALSGLDGASAALDAISNNVANAATIGFKQSRAQFSDIYAAALTSGGNSQIGIGTTVSQVAQDFSEGNISATNNPLDIAINGQGMFLMSKNGVNSYTRNGQFQVNNQGYVVNSAGYFLNGVGVNSAGVVQTGTTPAPIQILTTNQLPQATSSVSLGVNLNAADTVHALATLDMTDPTSYNSATSLTIYDSIGTPQTLTMYFNKTAANAWTVSCNVSGPNIPSLTSPANTPNCGQIGLTFSGAGVLTATLPAGAATSPMAPTLTPANAAAWGGTPGTLGNFGTGATALAAGALTLDLSELTQYGNPFGVNAVSQDGYESGQLSGLNVDANGLVQGRYTNGQSRTMGQIVLANFRNPNGLMNVGNNQWAESAASGQPQVSAPNTGSLGSLQSGAVEESNVDLTRELVNMITQQRAYQANAQSIKTQDQIMQTLVNLR